MTDSLQQEARAILDRLGEDPQRAMIQTLPNEQLSAAAIQTLLEHLPEYVKVALAEKAEELECPIEGVIEMAIASFLDEEAFRFEDCLLAKRQKG
jgi:hypothetical protein